MLLGMPKLVIFRRVGFSVLALAAVVIFFAGRPDSVEVNDHSFSRISIESDDDANNSRTQGAPQQQVVNGWTTNAYLRLISQQLDQVGALVPIDERPAALLLLGVLALTLQFGTQPSVRRESTAARQDDVSHPPLEDDQAQPVQSSDSQARTSTSGHSTSAPSPYQPVRTQPTRSSSPVPRVVAQEPSDSQEWL